MKSCSKCSEIKALEYFGREKRYADGRSNTCKKCRNKKLRAGPPVKGDRKELFEARYQKGCINDCWLWMGTLNRYGYGCFSHENKRQSSHRASWEIYRGAIPDGLLVCHKCDVRNCVNPEHLFLGTPKDNMVDMINKGRQVRVTKVPYEVVLLIRNSEKKGADISRETGLHPAYVSNVRLGKIRVNG